MSEISKAYEPQSVEDRWYEFWVQQGCFTADPARVTAQRPAYSIVIPPPNVTGVLHMGHVLNNTIQDILARKARMDGKEVLWLPGTDHAGIATEGMVAKKIWKDEKKSKRDVGREEFIKRVWEWKEKHGGIIIAQLKKLGCSCDWTREQFTMDPAYVQNVQRVFVDLYKKGLIYRGKRMVNWCPATQTALSDEEVEMKPQKGFMYHFKVEVAEAPGTWLTIATTRPETIPGDTAVAVNPKDPRYAQFIGQHIVRPLPAELPREQKLIPIVGDEHVDFEFGTGVLKVTPAHDKADFEIGQRHQLPVVEVINADGSMNALAGADLSGLDRFKARKVAVEKLTELGALVEEKPYENNVGYSQRADVPIEPRLSEQWFLKYPSVEKAKVCVEQEELGSAPASGAGASALAGDSGRVATKYDLEKPARLTAADEASAAAREARALPEKMHFHPQRWAKVYDHWLTNLQDWCISRQLWWGHRIPVWNKDTLGLNEHPVFQAAFDHFKRSGQSKAPFVLQYSEFSGAEVIWQFEKKSTKQIDAWGARASTLSKEFVKLIEGLNFKQDPDVLDTWFSSWLWPFATMGWPEQTETLKKFYPTTDLVTAPEIIFFWVARMIMAGYEYQGELPFQNVYFTGIVRDKQGRKMSKSLGNSPDPVDLIAQYGADAVRFGTMRSAPLGQDVLFDEKDVELGRNFCNKLWNACRFRQMQGGATETEIDPTLLTTDDRWILARLDVAIREVSDALASYNFSQAVQALFRFFWNEYCDWYVEASKAAFFGADAKLKANKLAVIDFVLGHTLRLFHPFVPFISEELWHGMGYAADLPADRGGRTIMFATWPKPLTDEERHYFGLDEAAEKVAAAKYELVTLGRNLRRELKLDPAKKLKFVLRPAGELAAAEIEVLKLLLNAEAVEVNAAYAPPKGTPGASNALGELFLPLEGVLHAGAERARLLKELAKIDSEIEKVQAKLANPAFTGKVPANVLAEHQQRLLDWQSKRRHIQDSLDNLGAN